MKSDIIYLAGPIDDIDTEEANNWRTYIGKQLYRAPVILFNPVMAYSIGKRESAGHKLRKLNRAIIDQSTLVVANLSGPGKAFGTIREIEYARAKDKQVFIIGVFPSLDAFDTTKFHSIADLVDELLDRYR